MRDLGGRATVIQQQGLASRFPSLNFKFFTCSELGVQVLHDVTRQTW